MATMGWAEKIREETGPKLQKFLRGPWPVLICAFVFALISLPSRLAGFSRPFWLDEADNNRIVLESFGFLDMRRLLFPSVQPVLDFALRKYFWFPLFGHQEWGLRFPSLVAGIFTVILCVFFTWRYFRGKSPLFSLAAAVALGSWASTHSVEIYYSAEARHYSFTSLVSLLWFYSYLNLRGNKGWRMFLWTSVVFLNTHFFSLPLVAGAWALEGARNLYFNRRETAGKLALTGLLIITGTIVLNYPALNELFHHFSLQLPPDQRPDLHSAWGRALEDWWGFLQYMEMPGHLPLFYAALALSPVIFSRRRSMRYASWKWLLFMGLILPLHFLRIRSTSNYPFYPRYYSPFFGLAFLTLLLAVGQVEALLPKRLWTQAWSRPWITAGLALLIPALLVPRLTFPQMHLPTANFSPEFKFYESLKTEEPVIFLAHPCYLSSVPILYWRFIGSPANSPVEFVSVFPFKLCEQAEIAPQAPMGASLDAFFRKHPVATVVLFQRNKSCPEVSDSSVTIGEKKGNCVAAKHGLKSAEEARAFAHLMHFP
jgi:hypothetical protein